MKKKILALTLAVAMTMQIGVGMVFGASALGDSGEIDSGRITSTTRTTQGYTYTIVAEVTNDDGMDVSSDYTYTWGGDVRSDGGYVTNQASVQLDTRNFDLNARATVTMSPKGAGVDIDKTFDFEVVRPARVSFSIPTATVLDSGDSFTIDGTVVTLDTVAHPGTGITVEIDGNTTSEVIDLVANKFDLMRGIGAYSRVDGSNVILVVENNNADNINKIVGKTNLAGVRPMHSDTTYYGTGTGTGSGSGGSGGNNNGGGGSSFGGNKVSSVATSVTKATAKIIASSLKALEVLIAGGDEAAITTLINKLGLKTVVTTNADGEKTTTPVLSLDMKVMQNKLSYEVFNSLVGLNLMVEIIGTDEKTYVLDASKFENPAPNRIFYPTALLMKMGKKA